MRRHTSSVLGALWALFIVGCGNSGSESSGTAAPIPETKTSTVSQASVISPTLAVVQCNDTVPVPSTLTTNAKGSPSTNYGTIYRGTVLAPNKIYRAGSVVVDPKGAISCVGCGCTLPSGYAQLAWSSAVISP